MSETVFDLAAALLGDLDADAQTLLGSFCTVCEQELEARLRPEVTRSAVAERFNVAAALLAAALYRDAADGGPDGDVRRFQVGEVSVDFGDGGELRGAALLRRQAELIMARCLRGGGGWLLEVRS